MKRELTPEQAQKQQAKKIAKQEAQARTDAKELTFRKKQSSNKIGKYYILILMIVLVLAYLVDEMATNTTGALQGNIICDLFNVPMINGKFDVLSDQYIDGVQAFTSLTMLFMVFAFILPFYKALADKYGRKPLLVINTVVMGLAMLIMMISPNWTVFAAGYILLNFVTPTDVHSLYFMEAAPAKHRVKLSLGAKAIAILGISSIGLLRMWFLVEGDVKSWHNVYIIPVIIALLVAFMVLCFIKETPKFLQSRIAELEKTPEQREAEKQEKNGESKKTGVLPALKFGFKHRQLRWLMILGLVFSFAMVAPSYYNSIMQQGGMSETEISLVVITYPFIYAAVTFLGGLISDKWGRKVMTCSYMALALIALVVFSLITSSMNNGVLAGIVYGFYVGGLWGSYDSIAYVIPQESSPTYLRASCMAVVLLMTIPGALVGAVVWMALVEFLPIAIAAIIMTAIGIVGAVLIIITRIGETHKVDMNEVTGTEWDKVKKQA